MGALILWLAAFAAAASPVPPSLAGAWEVEHVAVDAQDALHSHYKTDEPELVGRTLVIERSGQVTFNDDLSCAQKKWRGRPIAWRATFQRAYRRDPVGGRAAAATPTDFGLSIGPRERAVAYSICPSSEDRAAFPQDTWIALREPHVLFLHESPEYLLILRRRPAEARPAPSFDCARASSPTERAICGDFGLAGWDRSVDLALRRALERSPADERTLRASQAAWLEERNACGADAKCIDEKLWRRVGRLRPR